MKSNRLRDTGYIHFVTCVTCTSFLLTFRFGLFGMNWSGSWGEGREELGPEAASFQDSVGGCTSRGCHTVGPASCWGPGVTTRKCFSTPPQRHGGRRGVPIAVARGPTAALGLCPKAPRPRRRRSGKPRSAAPGRIPLRSGRPGSGSRPRGAGPAEGGGAAAGVEDGARTDRRKLSVCSWRTSVRNAAPFSA